MSKKFFGTDGIRGRVGTWPIHPEFMLKFGWALGRTLGLGRNARVLIGKDTRSSGYMFESVLEAGLSASGAQVYLLGPMPTPAIAYLTRTLRADAGVVISASHNPYYDNGVKIFGSDGMKLSDFYECEIEKHLNSSFDLPAAQVLGKASRIDGAEIRYVEFCKRFFPVTSSLQGMKIVLDCANGATYKIAPSVFYELGAEVVAIANQPDGTNINERCGATSVDVLVETVLSEKADIGFAYDGDGDRIVVVSSSGEILNGDAILYALLKLGSRMNRRLDGVVGTVMTNRALVHALDEIGVGFQASQVGDRHVLQRLKERGWSLGGESSGHIIDLDCNTTGDGIITSVRLLSGLALCQSSLADIMADYKPFPQKLRNLSIPNGLSFNEDLMFCKEVESIEKSLGSYGQVLIRPSGTEPLLRIMVQAVCESSVDQAMEYLTTLCQRQLACSNPVEA